MPEFYPFLRLNKTPLYAYNTSRQEYWSGLPFPYPGDLLDPGIKPGSPPLQPDCLPAEPPGETEVQCNQLVTGSWLITPGNSAILGTQCRSLLQADLALSSGSSQICVGEWRVMLLSPCITFIPTTMATLWAHWTMTGLAGERSWLVSTGWSSCIYISLQPFILAKTRKWFGTPKKWLEIYIFLGFNFVNCFKKELLDY